MDRPEGLGRFEGLEFLNYENVCPAEKDILHNILQGTESQEYFKGLFTFVNPLNDKLPEFVTEFGQGEGTDSSAENIVVLSQPTNINEGVDEMSAQFNGTPFDSMPTIPQHATTIVSQSTGPLHAIQPYFPGQTHLPIAVSATSAPISSVGPAPITNHPSGNTMMMFSPGIPQMIPQQSYYTPHAYYGPGGNNQHLSYVPIDNSVVSENYMAHSQGQNHKIHHDAHHAGLHSSSTSQGGNTYSKGRRKQQQQQQQQQQQVPANYYYNHTQYYPVPPYYNQQQLQNVTGHPIIMGPAHGMYLPHHPGMYQGHPGNDVDHHGSIPPQSMVPIPSNDMSFAQHHHPVYTHNSPSHNTRNYPHHGTTTTITAGRTTSGVPPPQASDSNAQNIERPGSLETDARVGGGGGEKSTPTNGTEIPTSSSYSSGTPKSMPDLSTSNGTITSTPEKETSTDPDANNPHDSPASEAKEAQVVNGADTDDSSTMIPPESSSSKTSVYSSNRKEFLNDTTTETIVNCAYSSADKLEVVPTKQINGDVDDDEEEGNVDYSDKPSSTIRDNLSADHKNSESDVTIRQQEQISAKKSCSSSSDVTSLHSDSLCKNNSTSSPNSTTIISQQPNKDDKVKNSEISTVEVSTSATSSNCSSSSSSNNIVAQHENKSAANRSWASVASVKNQNISNDGAARRYMSNNVNHANENAVVCGDARLSCYSDIVPSQREGHSEYTFDDPYPDEHDPIAHRLGEHFCKYGLEHQSIPLAPRGLHNHSNSCFLNAILQALLACPPFVNIFRSLAYILDKTPCKAAPVTQNVFEFVREFTPLIRSTATKKDKCRDNFIAGPSLEPVGIRKSIALLSKDTFKIEGRQEDAEEFLSFLLNCLHDEMIKVVKLLEIRREVRERVQDQIIDKAAPTVVNGGAEELKEDDDDQWQVMGAKNKSCLTRRTAVTKSPISEAFLGQMCLSLSRVNAVKKAHLEPFFTLQLAIQNDNVKSVKDALEAISVKEEVSGMTSASGNEVEAWRQVSLEGLPPILILHLKRFVYEKSGIHKINKKLDYSVDLEIGKELLSINSKNKYTPKQRQYKLFAVVYHDGEDAHKGHYVADCFHPSGGSLGGNGDGFDMTTHQ